MKDQEIKMDTSVIVTEQDLGDTLANSAMLVSFTERKWSAISTDRKAMKIVKDQTGAKGNAGRVQVNLVANNEGLHRELCKAISAAYRDHMELTRPWGETGYRMLPNSGFETYIVRMQGHQSKVVKLRDAFVASYANIRTASLHDLAGLADPSKYPPVDEIASRFGISFDFTPINGKSFPGLPPNYAAALQAQLERQVQARMQGVLDDQWAQTRKLLERFQNQLRPEGKVFDATVDDVLALPTNIRSFNVTREAKLDAIATVIERELGSYSTKSLERDNVRASAHAACTKVIGLLP